MLLYLQIDLPGTHERPLWITVPHPRVLLLNAYLVSAAAKRDSAGRNPKKKVFATEGLRSWAAEGIRDVPRKHYFFITPNVRSRLDFAGNSR
jgi:hypothetical protein